LRKLPQNYAVSAEKKSSFDQSLTIAIPIIVRHKVSGFREQGTGNREQRV
jgi:hypothetical protein